MKHPPKFIYFDLDDTLLDHKSAEKAALADLYDCYIELQSVQPDRLIDVYQGVNRDLWEQYGRGEIDRSTLQRKRFETTLKKLDLDTTLYTELGETYMRLYRNHWRWIDGAQKAVTKMSGQFGIGLLTNGFRETQKKKVERFNLEELADPVIISEETGYLKPQPEIFEYATRMAGHAPSDILYIGDSWQSDIQGGAGYGWRTAWFNSNGDPPGEENPAELTFNRFDRLCAWMNL